MTDAGIRRQINDLRTALHRQGASTRQIAAVISERLHLNPRVAFRHAVGLSQAQVADLYNRRWPSEHPKTFKQISYWECWQGPGSPASSASARAPSYEDLVRLAALYGCLVDDLLLGPRRAPITTAAGTPWPAEGLSGADASNYADETGHDALITVAILTGEGTTTVRLSRRQFTELLAAGGLVAMLPGTEPVPERGAAYFRQVLSAHQCGHHLIDPAAHITALSRQLGRIEHSRGAVSRADARELRQVQSEYAEHVSWLYRELGHLAACRAWIERAVTWALEAGDTSMVTYMMLRNASIALDQRDPAQAIDLARAAQHAPWQLPPVLQGVAKAYEARGHALTGTVASAELDDATRLIATRSVTSGPAYLRFFGADFADVQRATCYVDAGTPARAVTILQSKITALPVSHHRDRAAYLARLGTAHAADQVPDAAAIAAMGSLGEARRAGSEHVLAELGQIDRVLTTRWPGQENVRQFHDALQSTTAA
ncbi:hypothetical protein AB0M95_40230 [Sphaerisporangium sp. NPDC051017]|uniref:hypothetical protein n=1 Tax=Sphaerisporangium sp. NPDC051017 TaxID=3154636 RepID=UPI0034253E0F